MKPDHFFWVVLPYFSFTILFYKNIYTKNFIMQGKIWDFMVFGGSQKTIFVYILNWKYKISIYIVVATVVRHNIKFAIEIEI